MVVFLWSCFFGVIFSLECSIGVLLRWCFLVVWSITGLVFFGWCGGVFVVTGGVVVFLFWCGDICVVIFFYQGLTFVALPRSYAKNVDNSGVKRCFE